MRLQYITLIISWDFLTFNSDAIQNLELYKSGIPSNYGGRISSVLDVSMKEGNMRKYQLEGGLGLISSRIAVQGPIKKTLHLS